MPNPVVNFFTFNPTVIPVGGTVVTMSWSTTNANQVIVSNGIGVLPPDGTMQIFVDEDTEYTLTAKNGDQTATTAVSLDVEEPFVGIVPNGVWNTVNYDDEGNEVITTLPSFETVGNNFAAYRGGDIGVMEINSNGADIVLNGNVEILTLRPLADNNKVFVDGDVRWFSVDDAYGNNVTINGDVKYDFEVSNTIGGNFNFQDIFGDTFVENSQNITINSWSMDESLAYNSEGLEVNSGEIGNLFWDNVDASKASIGVLNEGIMIGDDNELVADTLIDYLEVRGDRTSADVWNADNTDVDLDGDQIVFRSQSANNTYIDNQDDSNGTILDTGAGDTHVRDEGTNSAFNLGIGDDTVVSEGEEEGFSVYLGGEGYDKLFKTGAEDVFAVGFEQVEVDLLSQGNLILEHMPEHLSLAFGEYGTIENVGTLLPFLDSIKGDGAYTFMNLTVLGVDDTQFDWFGF